jgi:hypothetical protein
MQQHPPVPRVSTNKPTCKPTSTPLIETTNNPTDKPARTPGIKPTTLPANSSKRKRLQKQRAAWHCNAMRQTSPSPPIRTQAQVTTTAAWVAPPSSNTRSQTRQLGMPLPSRWPGFTAAVMRHQRRQRKLVHLTCRIAQLENEVHQAMAVMDKDMGKLLNYRQLMSSPKYKNMEPFISQRIWAIGKWH